MNTISKRLLVTVLLAALAATGCSRRSAETAHQAPRRPANAAVAIKPEATQAGGTERATGMTEESESLADVAAGMSPIASAVAANTPAVATPIPAKWVEGTNYNVLMPAQPTSVDPSKVEVVEVFWYGCGHCNHLDPIIEGWRKTSKAPYVEFSRVHVMWNDTTRAHARLFYTIEALHKLEALHAAVFHEIHVNQNPLVGADPAATEALQRKFLKANGVTDAEFDGAYRSFGVEGRLRTAEDLTRRYRAQSVPLMVVNGKYTTDVGSAGNNETAMIELVNDLAASERRH